MAQPITRLVETRIKMINRVQPTLSIVYTCPCTVCHIRRSTEHVNALNKYRYDQKRINGRANIFTSWLKK